MFLYEETKMMKQVRIFRCSPEATIVKREGGGGRQHLYHSTQWHWWKSSITKNKKNGHKHAGIVKVKKTARKLVGW